MQHALILSPDDLDEIEDLYKDGAGVGTIAERFGVSKQTIRVALSDAFEGEPQEEDEEDFDLEVFVDEDLDQDDEDIDDEDPEAELEEDPDDSENLEHERFVFAEST